MMINYEIIELFNSNSANLIEKLIIYFKKTPKDSFSKERKKKSQLNFCF